VGRGRRPSADAGGGAGLRWSYLRAKIELSGGPVNLPQADLSESFVDPIVGACLGDLSED
jgi:hypothetical protein